MKTSCWHFTKNDCCFWSLYKNNRSVLIKSKTEAFFLSLNVGSFFFLWCKYVCLWQTKKNLEYYFGERKNVLWDCVLVEKRYNTSAENNVLREGVGSKKDIILRRTKMFSETVFGQKRYNTSPKKKCFLRLCLVEKRYNTSLKKCSSMFYCCLLPNKLFAST